MSVEFAGVWVYTFKQKGSVCLENNTIGSVICEMRKSRGMTQADLAEKLGVTDKAVSKWERGISCPDIALLPQIATIFDISLEQLMRVNSKTTQAGGKSGIKNIISLILKAVPIGAGISLVAMSVMKVIDVYEGLTLAGIGISCLAIYLIKE